MGNGLLMPRDFDGILSGIPHNPMLVSVYPWVLTGRLDTCTSISPSHRFGGKTKVQGVGILSMGS